MNPAMTNSAMAAAQAKMAVVIEKEAQALGYAEADPTFDVEGVDAAHKLTILASLAFGIPLQFDKVYMEGITKLTREDVSYAEELGYRIKNLGIARRTAEGIELRVHPTLIRHERLIANVNGVKNAVLVQSNAVGPTLYYGAGAGAGQPRRALPVGDGDGERPRPCAIGRHLSGPQRPSAHQAGVVIRGHGRARIRTRVPFGWGVESHPR